MTPTPRVIASPGTWIEGEAIRQLEATAALPGMVAAVGMPDLHPGRGNPVGAAFASSGLFYPHLVGSDIGCGMALFALDEPKRKARRDKLVGRLDGIEGPWDGDVREWLAARDLAPTDFDASLGTIGGGNHFAEVQTVDEAVDADAVAKLGVDPGCLLLLVHSGSRGLGESILRAHTATHGAGALEDGSPEAARYLARHDHAVRWGSANRALIAHRVCARLGADHARVLDVCHNSVTRARVGEAPCWLHRKGAAPHDRGPVVIPGSRGARSYLVVPEGDGAACLQSLAHGAGRKWTRSDARGRLKERLRASDLLRTPLGSAVICDDKDLLFEEAPQAYKDIETVIASLRDAGALRVIATLVPLVTYKLRSRPA
jgi:release factor H-coupled RctB family protein